MEGSSQLASPAPASAAIAASALPPEDSMPFDVSLEEAEKNLLLRAMERAGGNQTRAAVLLGITRDTLRYKMKKFNLR
jgi:two-component system, NtrC family, response regulator AtoC